MRLSEAQGRRVVSLATAETIGRVDGHLLDPAKRAVAALVLKKTPGDGDLLPWSSLSSFGDEAVMVPDAGVIVAADERLGELGDKRHREHGKRVLTTAGVELGCLDDVEVDPADGAVTGLVVGDEVLDGARLRAVGSYAVIIE